MIRRAMPALAAGLALAGPARAQDSGPWRVQLTPYVWATGLSATLRPLRSGPTVEADKSFGDLLGDLEAAFFLSGAVRYERLVLVGDFSYARTGTSGTASVLGLEVPGSANVRSTSFSLLGGYSVVERPGLTLDLLGGFRAWDVRASVSARVPSIPFSSVSFGEAWADPLIGARLRAELAPRWTGIVTADVGGFGAGSRSTWQVVGTLNYQATDNLFLSVGYRHLSVVRRDGPQRLDFDLSGPLFGATWRF